MVFILAGITGIFLVHSTASIFHGVILWISPTAIALYFNAFWSYGALCVVIYRIANHAMSLIKRLVICSLLIFLFFVLNCVAQQFYFTGLSAAMDKANLFSTLFKEYMLVI